MCMAASSDWLHARSASAGAVRETHKHAPFHMDLIVGIASGTVRLISDGSDDSASSGFHCVMTKAWPG